MRARQSVAWALGAASTFAAACADPPLVTRGGGESTDAGTPDAGAPIPGVLEVGREFRCTNDAVVALAPNAAPRLSRDEYARVVRDVLDVDVADLVLEIPDGPPTEREFDDTALGATREHVEAFASLSEAVASRVDLESLETRFGLACAELGDACVMRWVDALGLRLFRAPVVEQERDALGEVAAQARESELPWDAGFRFVLRAMLSSPRFVYHLEPAARDGALALDAFAFAARLSFAVWGSAPDEPLLESASKGKLDDPESFQRELDRMLDDPRTIEHGITFLDDWFDLHRTETVGGIGVDMQANGAELFPDFDVALLPLMRDETRRLFRAVLEARRSLEHIHDWETTTVSEGLARYYGFPDAEPGVATYDTSGIPERGGLLTHASMASIGGPGSSTTQAGLFVLEQILCGAVPEPPPAAAASIAATSRGTSSSPEARREESAARVENPACGTCHATFEPLAWGLSHFDAVGRYLPAEPTEPASSQGWSEAGWISFPDAPERRVPYETLAELLGKLAASERVRDCSLLKTYEYVARRSLTGEDGCALSALREGLSTAPSYHELLRAIVSNSGFRRAPDEGTEP